MTDRLVGGDRGDAARRKLVSQAAALIATRGLDAFSVDELALRAHCSRATIYRHAGGRTALIEAVLATTAAPVLEAIHAEAAGAVGEERARVAITEAVRALRADRVIRQFLRPANLIASTPTVLASPTVLAVAAELVGIDPDDAVAARFAIRSVLTMLLWPAAPEEEAELVDSIVAGVSHRRASD
ncbi:TetR/AcrR family transcriptional regulator [Gordonia amicalis]|uniref:TetR/AcrR family transcriptional regulator n=1 Tax=Gordonia amicalis TaxID=89053 RepID=UPI0002A644DE|nr:helix-turn-helix domain-containing protein [Gordonia amicalis]MCZ4651959.1 helix-turn-helix domain containing protein [Gordonia amicalis]MDJ0452745.1 helix-turn-helix domain-containing protein [Gordonia amicalis]MDV7075349.1 helix-turn-helix domain-containing protein [Gordonia amicalis]NKX76494.1 helix-turn-helix transcriptional regulator [Gordonia amicalis]GAC51490.1 putative TetR family transcriptional regulator [Gordonia amicalis NBRC 100051 = JCM 11271]